LLNLFGRPGHVERHEVHGSASKVKVAEPFYGDHGMYKERKIREAAYKKFNFEADQEMDEYMHEIYAEYRIVDYSADIRCGEPITLGNVSSIESAQKWNADFEALSYVIMQYTGADFDMFQCGMALSYHMGIDGEFCGLSEDMKEKYQADFCGFLETKAGLLRGLINAKGRVIMRDDGITNVFFVIGARKV
jgi:hypothetical protein